MLNDTLEQVFSEFTEPSHGKKMRWLEPNDKVSKLGTAFKVPILTANFKPVKVRHVPILEPSTGDLKALISNVDYASIMTPPVKKIPIERLSDEDGRNVNAFIEEMTDKPIIEVFSELFIGKTEKLSSVKSTLRMAIEKLTVVQTDEKNRINRRYRTLPVFDDNNVMVGMLSYTDILKKIHNCEEFTSKRIKDSNIYKPAEGLTTLECDKTLYDAVMILEGALFTHIPIIKKEGSRIVTGIVDDLTIATYQHPILFESFSELPLHEIQTMVSEENTVKPTDSVRDVIEKFLTVTYPDRPTAILVCTKDNNEELVLAGIVSYTDLLKKFVSWQQGNIQPDQEE